MTAPANRAPDGDPVLVRREQVRRLITMAQRAGYALYALSVIGFVAGFARNFDGLTVTVIQIGLIGGSILLAPAFVFTYAVKAADRADAEDDWR